MTSGWSHACTKRAPEVAARRRQASYASAYIAPVTVTVAPKARIRATSTEDAASGTKMCACMPSRRATNATARPWFPGQHAGRLVRGAVSMTSAEASARHQFDGDEHRDGLHQQQGHQNHQLDGCGLQGRRATEQHPHEGSRKGH